MGMNSIPSCQVCGTVMQQSDLQAKKSNPSVSKLTTAAIATGASLDATLNVGEKVADKIEQHVNQFAKDFSIKAKKVASEAVENAKDEIYKLPKKVKHSVKWGVAAVGALMVGSLALIDKDKDGKSDALEALSALASKFVNPS